MSVIGALREGLRATDRTCDLPSRDAGIPVHENMSPRLHAQCDKLTELKQSHTTINWSEHTVHGYMNIMKNCIPRVCHLYIHVCNVTV